MVSGDYRAGIGLKVDTMIDIKEASIDELEILDSNDSGLVAIAKAKRSSKDVVNLADYRAEVGTKIGRAHV